MKKLGELTLEEKIGQLFMVGFQDGEDIIKKLSDYKFGNIIYFSRNLNDAKKTVKTSISIQKHLFNSIGIPAFISADQEGGLVSRFSDGATCFNGAMTIAGTNSPAIANKVGRRVGIELLSYGVN